jgi:hypothetical protein
LDVAGNVSQEVHVTYGVDFPKAMLEPRTELVMKCWNWYKNNNYAYTDEFVELSENNWIHYTNRIQRPIRQIKKQEIQQKKKYFEELLKEVKKELDKKNVKFETPPPATASTTTSTASENGVSFFKLVDELPTLAMTTTVRTTADFSEREYYAQITKKNQLEELCYIRDQLLQQNDQAKKRIVELQTENEDLKKQNQGAVEKIKSIEEMLIDLYAELSIIILTTHSDILKLKKEIVKELLEVENEVESNVEEEVFKTFIFLYNENEQLYSPLVTVEKIKYLQKIIIQKYVLERNGFISTIQKRMDLTFLEKNEQFLNELSNILSILFVTNGIFDMEITNKKIQLMKNYLPNLLMLFPILKEELINICKG